MKNLILASVLMFIVSGCSSMNPFAGITGDTLQEKVANDITRAAEIATKYQPGGPSAKCMTYLSNLVGPGNTLLNENTAGVISFAIKQYLLKSASGHDEAAFKEQCGSFAAGVLIEASKQSPGGSRIF